MSTLPVARAALGYRGYTREISPDGRQPLIYDYDYVDPAPLARFSGKLTASRRRVRGCSRPTTTGSAWSGPATKCGSSSRRRVCPACPTGWTRSYRRPDDRLLQGRRPVHGHERLHRAAPLAANAGVPVRSRCQAAKRPRLRIVPARLSDPASRGGGEATIDCAGIPRVRAYSRRGRGSASWRHFRSMSGTGLESFANLRGQLLVSMRRKLVEAQGFVGLIDGILIHADLARSRRPAGRAARRSSD